MYKPQRSDKLSYKIIENETIILDSRINKEIHQLNEVASLVWSLCDGSHTVEKIVGIICAEFEIDLSVAHYDIQRLLAEFMNKSLLKNSSVE